MGYATQVKKLSDFHDDYGLPGSEEDGQNDPDADEDEDDDEMSEEEDAMMDGAEDMSDFDDDDLEE